MSKCYCDGCGKLRSDVRSVGRDYNGDPDAPSLCFLCRKESERGREYSAEHGCYIPRKGFIYYED